MKKSFELFFAFFYFLISFVKQNKIKISLKKYKIKETLDNLVYLTLRNTQLREFTK